MRQLEREKAAAAGEVRARQLEAFDTLARVIGDLEAGRWPVPADRAFMSAAWRRFGASGYEELDKAFGLKDRHGGGPGFRSGLSIRDRNAALRAAHAEILTGVPAATAAKRICAEFLAMLGGVSATHDFALRPYIERALATGKGLPAAASLALILRQMPPGANDVPAIVVDTDGNTVGNGNTRPRPSKEPPWYPPSSPSAAIPAGLSSPNPSRARARATR